jgi:hypothetical protein
MYGLKAVPFREASFSAAFGAAVDPPLGSLGCRWLFCDRDRVGHRIVVKLSFARAEGRNYRQLPDRARLREEPAPADFIYSKRYSLFQLDVSGLMSFFCHGSTKGRRERLLRNCYVRWQREEMGSRTAFAGPGVLLERAFLIQVRHAQGQFTTWQTMAVLLPYSSVLIALGSFGLVTGLLKWPKLL